MKVKYVGNRPMVSIMCSGRANYVFYKDNDFTQEVNDPQHIAQLLRSVQHRFETIVENVLVPKKEEVKNMEASALSHPSIADTPPHKPIEPPKPKKTVPVKQVKVSGAKK